jgi:hypothetical protein
MILTDGCGCGWLKTIEICKFFSMYLSVYDRLFLLSLSSSSVSRRMPDARIRIKVSRRFVFLTIVLVLPFFRIPVRCRLSNCCSNYVPSTLCLSVYLSSLFFLLNSPLERSSRKIHDPNCCFSLCFFRLLRIVSVVSCFISKLNLRL